MEDTKIDFFNLRQFETGFPETYSFLGNSDQANAISPEHKDQIHFLNEEATDFLGKYLEYSKVLSGPIHNNLSWKPVNSNYFKTITEFNVNEHSGEEVKKWLYNRGIPFSKYVYAIRANRQAIMLTWKMVIKYWDRLFNSGLTIIDESLNLCLFCFERGEIYFGKDKIFNPEDVCEKMLELNELKEKYPFLNFPY